MSLPEGARPVPGTEGYGGLSKEAISTIDDIVFEDVHRPILHFFLSARAPFSMLARAQVLTALFNARGRAFYERNGWILARFTQHRVFPFSRWVYVKRL